MLDIGDEDIRIINIFIIGIKTYNIQRKINK